MKHNMGIKDAVIRVVIAVIIALPAFYFTSWWGLLAFFFLITAYFGYCPFYKLFGISTVKKNEVKKLY